MHVFIQFVEYKTLLAVRITDIGYLEDDMINIFMDSMALTRPAVPKLFSH